MMRSTLHASLCLFLTACVLALAGCAKDKLTRERFDMVQQHMTTQAQVADLLGEPTEQLGSQWFFERHDRGVTVLIDFDQEGQVARKQWIDANTREWFDSHEK
ncbi:MAG TPA: hypothetical protein PKK06_01530 [Phycisphaerae bacterium]|nr:hypothetical protein [Phycisphaerae bacterium]HNU44193.1 hypothetical protein [Phycisphaerae bacterium]